MRRAYRQATRRSRSIFLELLARTIPGSKYAQLASSRLLEFGKAVKTTIQHSLYGQIVFDTEANRITVEHGDLAERLTWLMKPKNVELLGPGYYPDKFLQACQVLGISQGIESVKTEGELTLPPGAVY